MGLLARSRVQCWLAGLQDESDDAHPIGKRALRPADHTATVVEVREGNVVYGREVPVAVYASEVRELPVPVAENLRLRRLHAWLFLARHGAAGAGTDATEWTLSFAALPYSQNRFFTTRLRRVTHRRVDEIAHTIVKGLNASQESNDPEQRLQDVLQSQTFVPFTHARQMAGAWMICPSHSPELARKPRFDRQQDYTLGICHHPNDCIGFLSQDLRVQHLLDLTDANRLFSHLPNADQRKKGPVARNVSRVAIDKKNEVMQLAMQLALAGVVDGDTEEERRSREGRHVVRQVEQIYRGIMYEWSRKDEPPGGALPAEQPPPALDDEVFESLRATLSRIGGSTAIPRLVAKIADLSDRVDADHLLWIVACPEDWALPKPLVEVLQQSLSELDRSDPLYARVVERLSRSR